MFRKDFLAVLGTALCLTAISASAQDKFYRLSFDIVDMGTSIGAPSAVVRDGVPGSLAVSGRKMAFTATDAGEGRIKLSIFFASQDGSSPATVIVKDGLPGSVSDGRFSFTFIASEEQHV